MSQLEESGKTRSPADHNEPQLTSVEKVVSRHGRAYQSHRKAAEKALLKLTIKRAVGSADTRNADDLRSHNQRQPHFDS